MGVLLAYLTRYRIGADMVAVCNSKVVDLPVQIHLVCFSYQAVQDVNVLFSRRICTVCITAMQQHSVIDN